MVDDTRSDRPGFALPLLLAGAFRATVDALHAELAEQGHEAARPVHGFALQAIGPDGASTSDVARRLGVSKQAAAKTVAGLERLGYVVTAADPADGRRRVARRTPRGDDLLLRSAEVFGRLRAAWAAELGAGRLGALEDDLERIAGPASAKLGDLPGWLR